MQLLICSVYILKFSEVMRDKYLRESHHSRKTLHRPFGLFFLRGDYRRRVPKRVPHRIPIFTPGSSLWIDNHQSLPLSSAFFPPDFVGDLFLASLLELSSLRIPWALVLPVTRMICSILTHPFRSL